MEKMEKRRDEMPFKGGRMDRIVGDL